MLGSYPLRRTPTRERQFRIVKWSPTIPPTSPHTDPQHGLDGVAIPGIGDGLMDSATRIQYIDGKLMQLRIASDLQYIVDTAAGDLDDAGGDVLMARSPALPENLDYLTAPPFSP